MHERLKLNLRYSRRLHGSQEYTITVEATNVSNEPLTGIAVEPQLVPGTSYTPEEAVTSAAFGNLEAQSRALVAELETQLAIAYRRNRRSRRSHGDGDDSSQSMLEITSFLFLGFLASGQVGTLGLGRKGIPYWAREACRVRKWDDIVRLESQIMSEEPDESFLKKAFLINKQKLKGVLSEMESTPRNLSSRQELDQGVTIKPGETVAFPFRCRAPILHKSRDMEARFKVTYESLDQETGYCTIGEEIPFFASPLAPLWGGVLGAISGAIIKSIWIMPVSATSSKFWLQLLASILLALIITTVTRRSKETHKGITVEDLGGGFVIGALAGVFSENFLEFLKQLIPTAMESGINPTP